MSSPVNQSGKPRLSSSKIGTFLNCRRKYYWIYVQNLSPITRADYFQTGTVVHDLRERWVKGELQIEDVKNLKEFVQQHYPSNDAITTEKVALESATLFNHYVQSLQDDDEFKLVSPEMTLELDTGEFLLYTRFDGLAIDSDNNYYRDELKTSSRMDSGYLTGLRKGLQTGIAYWVAEEVLDEKLHGSLFEILVKTKQPQYQRMPVLKDGFVVRETKECVYGVWEEIKRCGSDKKLFYPSMNCSFGKSVCPYETLCREDTVMKRKHFFTEYYPTEKKETETED